jgi:hypothetical protein
MVAALRDELIEAATAPELAVPRGIIVLGSKGNWLADAPAAEGDKAPATPPFADESADALGMAPAACPALAGVVPVVEDGVRY